ncbi:tRNA glutamyl-Q(34) synthetase GluQRS [Colwellia sp. E2M01]|uniref:tRNA glutamyl-Q(34) synthetase GluQRS n=1 Tax=Colwellia sp. E2M01 TaxID=2841561 RepID=UPI001C0919C3|nr:tRNA glutamyl-Q(34) synthetase GluQRS [Colwellia sp. E2M01]MBU2871396.1 tRNA glutamyl-Q(34) synthetase GluQRS [Colwellia sp. E2M01]
MPIQASHYRGRFAPSPSGLLHFGSLIAALASFLDAKSCVNNHGGQGKWLVRIEDIDPPREQKGASAAILKTLEAFGLHWDETELYQSNQSDYYHDILANLSQQHLSYYCQCTRAAIKAIGGIYQGHCRTANNSAENSAIRLVNQYGLYQFDDIFQGQVNCDKALANEDFIIHRKDGLFAYQLAVVADDIAQGITHIVRGCDLLEPTARQLTLYKTLHKSFATANFTVNNTIVNDLKVNTPQFGHIPLAVTTDGYKLSKQNKAPAIDNNKPQPALIAALSFLGQAPLPELAQASVDEIIHWAITHWQRDNVPKVVEINIS